MTHFKSLPYLVALILVSCSSKTTEPTDNTSNNFIPLKIGNIWNYNSEMYDSTGSSIGVWSDTVKIIGDTTINGELWYWSYSRFHDGISTSLAKVSSSGYLVYDSQVLINSGVLRYKYPGSVGETYLVKMQFIDSLYSYSRQIMSVNANVTVPSGTYSCYLYYNARLRLTDFAEVLEAEYYICPGMGIVRQNFYKTTKSGLRYLQSKSELKRVVIQ